MNPIDTEIVDATSSLGDPNKQPTPGELKKLRKVYVTILHPRVAACGHKLDLQRQPRMRNCANCWFAWFQNHGEIVQQLDEMYTVHGPAVIIELQGQKFYHRWRQFMSTVAHFNLGGEQNATV